MTDFEAISFLTLTPDNPSNTTITSEDGKTLYVVSSQMGRQGTIVRICDPRGAVIATVEYRATGSPLTRLTLGGRKPVSLGSWLNKSLIPFKDDVTFKDDAGRRYKWKRNAPDGSLQLFAEDDDFHLAIARFFRSTMTDKTDPPSMKPATLAIRSRAEEIRDMVVASFLCLERERRADEVAAENRIAASVLRGQQTTSGFVGGMY